MFAFKTIKADSHLNLLASLKEFKPKDDNDDSVEVEITCDWVDHYDNDIYNKCVTYLSNYLDSPKVKERLTDLLPLREAENELLDAGAIAEDEWIEKLLDAGADFNIVDKDNYLPLVLVWYEFRQDFIPSVKARNAVLLLIKAGSDPLLENNIRINLRVDYICCMQVL